MCFPKSFCKYMIYLAYSATGNMFCSFSSGNKMLRRKDNLLNAVISM